jgi:ubiquitin-protein ligase
MQSLLSDPNPNSPANSEARPCGGGWRSSRRGAAAAALRLQHRAADRRLPLPTQLVRCVVLLPQAARLYNEDRREYNRRVKAVVEASWADDGEDEEEGDEEEGA